MTRVCGATMRSSDTGGGGLPADVPQSFMPTAGRAGALSACQQRDHGDDPGGGLPISAGRGRGDGHAGEKSSGDKAQAVAVLQAKRPEPHRDAATSSYDTGSTPATLAEARPADGILLQSGGGSGFEESI
jgi:hypothetical protein